MSFLYALEDINSSLFHNNTLSCDTTDNRSLEDLNNEILDITIEHYSDDRIYSRSIENDSILSLQQNYIGEKI